MTILNLIENKLKDLLVPGRTLVYFASGPIIKESYHTLPYENIILVDNTFRRIHNGFRTEIPALKAVDRIICLGMDCLQSVQLLKNLDWKIDCMISINEGLYEGGGYYPINSDVFLGFVCSILSDTIIHIGYKDYYSGPEYHHLKEHWLDIPYESVKVLKNTDSGYLSPEIFTDNKKYAENADVTLLSNKSTRQNILKRNRKEILILHKRIWEDIGGLDASFVRFENKRQKDIVFKIINTDFQNIFPLHVQGKHEGYTTYDLHSILSLCNANRWEHIGLVPSFGIYKKLIDRISNEEMEYPKRINLYHLNKDDYADIYNIQ